MTTRYDALIVGAGPTGLVLALWLTRQGLRVRIIDKTDGPGSTSRAMAVQARTLELYRQLDIAESVVSAGRRNPAVNLWVRGERRARLSFVDAGAGLTPYPFLLVYPQDHHEALLAERLKSLNYRAQPRQLSEDDAKPLVGRHRAESYAASGWRRAHSNIPLGAR